MRPVFTSWLLPAVFLAGIGQGVTVDSVSAQSIAAPTLEGRWTGTMNQAGEQLRVVVTIERASDGRLVGSVAGADYGNTVFEIDAVEQSGTRVKLVVGTASGGFEGVLSGDHTKLTGVWSQLAIGTPLELIRLPTSPSPPARSQP